MTTVLSQSPLHQVMLATCVGVQGLRQDVGKLRIPVYFHQGSKVVSGVWVGGHALGGGERETYSVMSPPPAASRKLVMQTQRNVMDKSGSTSPSPRALEDLVEVFDQGTGRMSVMTRDMTVQIGGIPSPDSRIAGDTEGNRSRFVPRDEPASISYRDGRYSLA